MSNELDTLKRGKPEAVVADLFLRRWSPRAFADKPVTESDLRSIFSAGQWAASSYNEQPWRFIVGLRGDATWQHILDALLPLNQAWAKAAPVLYATVAKKTFSQNSMPNRVATHDVGAASAQISLQATALGLHTHGMGGFEIDKLRASLGIPEDFEPVACWALGYLGDPATLNDQQHDAELKPRERKPLAEIVYGHWGKPAF